MRVGGWMGVVKRVICVRARVRDLCARTRTHTHTHTHLHLLLPLPLLLLLLLLLFLLPLLLPLRITVATLPHSISVLFITLRCQLVLSTCINTYKT